ncbi:RNA polymerase sigma-70 factor [Flammeovirga kamogawensis]|nr:RNA polymerase sigma-70 factor [Flammeovirga kamogawensis]
MNSNEYHYLAQLPLPFTIKYTIVALVPEIKTKEQFETLFKVQYPKLCSYANSILNDIQASEDIIQDLLFKLWESRNSLEITTSIEAYLTRSVKNKALNVLRHTEVKDQYKNYNEELINEASSNELLLLEAKELDQKIRNSIDTMPTKRKEIFLLSRFDGLKYAEISKQLNISIKTVENQMSSALKYLRKELTGFLTLLIIFFIKNF